MVVSLSSCAKNDAVKNFNVLAGDIKQLQDNISNKTTEAETLLDGTNAKDLADPKLLDQLRSEINSAKNLSVNVPDIASDTDAIKQQNQVLTRKKSELQKQSESLDIAVSEIKESKQKLIDQIAAEKEAKIIDAITPKDTHSIIATDDNGNKEKITITIGKWIKGSDTALLDKAWKIVGGTGSMPLTGAFHTENGAYAFGTVSIENMTPNFSAKSFDGGKSWVYLGNGYEQAVQARQYLSGVSCDTEDNNPLVEADMTSNKWGPAPFVTGLLNVFTPKYPEGNPDLTDNTFYLSSNVTWADDKVEVKIGKTW
jgi:hypothetical protein